MCLPAAAITPRIFVSAEDLCRAVADVSFDELLPRCLLLATAVAHGLREPAVSDIAYKCYCNRQDRRGQTSIHQLVVMTKQAVQVRCM